MSSAQPTSTESRALALLGQGVSPEMVASALGVTPSAISQLLSREDFATKVTELRYEGLIKHNSRDAAYDSLEDRLIEKMQDCLPMMFDPLKILRAIQVINAAKRRGTNAGTDSIMSKQTVVQLNLPVSITQHFSQTNNTVVNNTNNSEDRKLTMNSNNQVIKAGEQDLITVQSSQMPNLLSASLQSKIQDKVNNLLNTQLAKERALEYVPNQ